MTSCARPADQRQTSFSNLIYTAPRSSKLKGCSRLRVTPPVQCKWIPRDHRPWASVKEGVAYVKPSLSRGQYFIFPPQYIRAYLSLSFVQPFW